MLWDGAVGVPCASESGASERIKTNPASCKVRFDGTSLSIAEWSARVLRTRFLMVIPASIERTEAGTTSYPS